MAQPITSIGKLRQIASKVQFVYVVPVKFPCVCYSHVIMLCAGKSA